MIVRQGMFFNYEKRHHARKCVIWPILGTSFSKNRYIYFYFIIKGNLNNKILRKERFGNELFIFFMDLFW